MLERERHQTIVRVLQQNKFATIHEIASLVKSSEATVRRDFTQLSDAGLINRVRGGAEVVSSPQTTQPLISETPFEHRKGLQLEKKRLIAKKAVSLCVDDETIIIDGGSTTYQMVEFLTGSHLQIITNSFAIAKYLTQQSKNNIIIPGGLIYPESQLILNPFDNDIFKNYYASKVFMGVGGIDKNGATNTDMPLIQSEKAMIENAKELIILVDSSKFQKRGNLMLCGFDKIHTIITDSDITEENKEMVEAAGTNLIIV